MKGSVVALGSLLVAIGVIASNQCSVQAQIVAAPADAGTVVTPAGGTFTITGGTKAGSNLFHGFQQFGLNAGQTANFVSPAAIQNILGPARVDRQRGQSGSRSRANPEPDRGHCG